MCDFDNVKGGKVYDDTVLESIFDRGKTFIRTANQEFFSFSSDEDLKITKGTRLKLLKKADIITSVMIIQDSKDGKNLSTISVKNISMCDSDSFLK